MLLLHELMHHLAAQLIWAVLAVKIETSIRTWCMHGNMVRAWMHKLKMLCRQPAECDMFIHLQRCSMDNLGDCLLQASSSGHVPAPSMLSAATAAQVTSTLQYQVSIPDMAAWVTCCNSCYLACLATLFRTASQHHLAAQGRQSYLMMPYIRHGVAKLRGVAVLQSHAAAAPPVTQPKQTARPADAEAETYQISPYRYSCVC